MYESGLDWVAIVGILGTLGGVGVGAFVTWKIQESQIKHSDATLFQKERFDAYSQFVATANKVIACWKFDQLGLEDTDKFIDSFNRLHLVATDNVLKHAKLMHNKVVELQREVLEGEISESVISEFIEISANFIHAARHELRVKN